MFNTCEEAIRGVIACSVSSLILFFFFERRFFVNVVVKKHYFNLVKEFIYQDISQYWLYQFCILSPVSLILKESDVGSLLSWHYWALNQLSTRLLSYLF